jgi:hypothetical protein
MVTTSIKYILDTSLGVSKQYLPTTLIIIYATWYQVIEAFKWIFLSILEIISILWKNDMREWYKMFGILEFYSWSIEYKLGMNVNREYCELMCNANVHIKRLKKKIYHLTAHSYLVEYIAMVTNIRKLHTKSRTQKLLILIVTQKRIFRDIIPTFQNILYNNAKCIGRRFKHSSLAVYSRWLFYHLEPSR